MKTIKPWKRVIATAAAGSVALFGAACEVEDEPDDTTVVDEEEGGDTDVVVTEEEGGDTGGDMGGTTPAETES